MLAKLFEPALSDLLHLCEMAYPLEACGALLGKGDGEASPWQVTRVISTPNQSGDDPRRSYLIAPEHQLAVERDAEQAGEQVLGYFHSHPDDSASPSDADRAQAWPGYLYVICSVVKARARDIAAFTLLNQAGPLHYVPIAPTGPMNQPTLEMPSCPLPS